MKYAKSDASVGFGMHKGGAHIGKAMASLGLRHVSGLWSFQGSKPFLYEGRLYTSMGDRLLCTDLDRDVTYWSKTFASPTDKDRETVDNVLSPPSLCNGKVFVGTLHGKVFCLSARTGDEIWSADAGEPIVFQPAIAQGRLYAGSADGSLFCLETGDRADDGWLMWGATPAHNGLAETAASPIEASVGQEVPV
jgi:outer membrane protein assembly factor BamB